MMDILTGLHSTRKCRVQQVMEMTAKIIHPVITAATQQHI
jgi:hypothetical protein